MLYTFMLFVTHYCFVVLVLHVPCSRWSRCWGWCLMLYRPSFRYAFMLALFIYAFCNALLLCSSGCCMPRSLGGADAGADNRCFIVLNMLLCFMLYAFHAFSELWNLVPSRRKVVFQKSEAGYYILLLKMRDLLWSSCCVVPVSTLKRTSQFKGEDEKTTTYWTLISHTILSISPKPSIYLGPV